MRQLGRHVSERHDIVVIGGSQAGLSVSYRLNQCGMDHIVLERADDVGHAWSHERWDSFTLVTPNWFLRLPDFAYDGDGPDAYLPRDEIVRYLKDFRTMVQPPIRHGVEVTGLRLGDGNWVLQTGSGEIRTRNVVVATGYFHRPKVPDMAAALPGDIAQFDPYSYKNPSALPDGATLIVGSSMSGVQICEDFVEAGRDVYLAVGAGNRVPRMYRGRDAFAWMVDMGWLTKPINPVTHEERYAASMMLTGARDRHGVNLHSLAARGVTLAGRLNGFEGGVAHFGNDLNVRVAESDAFADEFKHVVDDYIREHGLDVPETGTGNTDEGMPCEGPRYAELERVDLAAAGISSIIWATGFACDFDWIREPVLDARGFPRQQRGISDLPGLYFCGQHWLHTFSSGGFFGVGEDPAHIAEHIRLRLEAAA